MGEFLAYSAECVEGEFSEVRTGHWSMASCLREKATRKGGKRNARVCARRTEVFRSSRGVPRPDGGIRCLAGRSQGAYGGLRVRRWRRRGLRHLQRARRGDPEPDNGRVSVNTVQ